MYFKYVFQLLVFQLLHNTAAYTYIWQQRQADTDCKQEEISDAQ